MIGSQSHEIVHKIVHEHAEMKKGEGPCLWLNKIGMPPSTGQRKKIIIHVIYVTYHISNRFADFF